MRAADTITSCYLCGSGLPETPSRDHVPPKQFFSPLVLEVLKPDRLWTLPTHVECNKAYERDEQYAVTTLAPLARNSWAGGALNIDNIGRFTRGEPGAKLFAKIYREYSWQRFSGPAGQGVVAVDKSIDPSLTGNRMPRSVGY